MVIACATDSSHPGPIVRISPDELHCADPAFADEIYAGARRKRNKPEHFLRSLAGPTTVSAFGTVDHDLHRIRRNAMNKFFSRAQVSRLEPEIKELVGQLCDKLLREWHSFLGSPPLGLVSLRSHFRELSSMVASNAPH